MTGTSLQGKTVLELQELAQQTPVHDRRRAKQRLSRAARLHLIDIVSRWSGPAIALIAGVSIYLAVIAGRSYPARAATWALMMLAALYVCRRLRSEFRTGSMLSSKPFRWRASYTSCLSVLGVILASAPILLAPVAAPPAFGAQIIALALIVSFSAALLHSAHFLSAAALALPGALFAVLAALRGGDTGLLVACVATTILGVSGLYLANRYLERNAARRYPRTTFLRRELDRQIATELGHTDRDASAAQA